jgi:hypothetical protein
MAKAKILITPELVRDFFANDAMLGCVVLQPLAHIRANWKLIWATHEARYRPEQNSFAELMNDLIEEISKTTPPNRYHDSEDRLVECVREHLNWSISKVNGRWDGADCDSIREQGGFGDVYQTDLVAAATGRIWAALERGQLRFENMEESHRNVLAAVLSIVLYHRS